MNPKEILKEVLKYAPFFAYVLPVLGFAAILAIIKSLDIGDQRIPAFTTLFFIFIMCFFLIFRALTKANQKILQITGYVLISFLVTFCCGSLTLLFTCVFFNWPMPIKEVLRAIKEILEICFSK